MNVFKEMFYSVYNYKYYPQFLKNNKAKIFGVGILIVTLCFMIDTIIPAGVFMLKGGLTAAIETIPDFHLKDGILEMEESYRLDNGYTLVYVDADPDFIFYSAKELEDDLEEYEQVILMDCEKMVLKDDGEVVELYYDTLEIDFERDDLKVLIPYLYSFAVFFIIFAYFMDAGLFFFGVIFVALIGMIIASAMNKKLSFGQLYKLGVYSRTLPLILKALKNLLPFTIPMFWIINFGISAVILIAAIKNIPDRQTPQMQQTEGMPVQPNTNGSVYYDPRMTNQK